MLKNRFLFRPSRLILLMLLLMAVISIVAICYLFSQPWLQLLTFCFAFGYFAYLVRRYYLLNLAAILGIERLADGQWLLSLSSGDQVKAQLERDSTLTSFFSILCFSCEKSGNKYGCLVCHDSLEANQYAALLFAIKWS